MVRGIFAADRSAVPSQMPGGVTSLPALNGGIGGVTGGTGYVLNPLGRGMGRIAQQTLPTKCNTEECRQEQARAKAEADAKAKKQKEDDDLLFEASGQRVEDLDRAKKERQAARDEVEVRRMEREANKYYGRERAKYCSGAEDYSTVCDNRLKAKKVFENRRAGDAASEQRLRDAEAEFKRIEREQTDAIDLRKRGAGGVKVLDEKRVREGQERRATESAEEAPAPAPSAPVRRQRTRSGGSSGSSAAPAAPAPRERTRTR